MSNTDLDKALDMTLRQRIRFAWHVIRDRHWPVLIDDFGYRCSCGVALLFEEDTDQ